MAATPLELGLAVKRLQWRHHREGNARLTRELGVSLVQWDVLRHLGRRPEASLHELAALTFQTDQSMGELARRMVDRGLLERVPGPGRVVRHRLTGEGERVRAAGAGIFEGVLAETVGTLSEAERTTLLELVVRATGAQ